MLDWYKIAILVNEDTMNRCTGEDYYLSDVDGYTKGGGVNI